MRPLLVGIGALVIILGLACGGPAATPTPAPPTATPVPTATPTPQVKEAASLVQGAQEAMKKVKSFKMKGQVTFTTTGTPVPGMPTGPQTITAEFSDNSRHMVFGELEMIEVDKVTYMRMSKDAPWQKTPAEPSGAPGEELSGDLLKDLGNVASAGAEPCPRGGLCQVVTATKTGTEGGKETFKYWIGLSDGLIYKVQSTEVSAEGKTEMSIEFYDYNVPVTIKAPIP